MLAGQFGALTEEVAAFAAYGFDDNVFAGVLGQKLLGGLDQVGVEATGQTTVGGDQDQLDALFGAYSEQGQFTGFVVAPGGARNTGQHLFEHGRVRTRGNHALLGAAQLGRRNHLHGLGDLLRVFDRPDAPANVN